MSTLHSHHIFIFSFKWNNSNSLGDDFGKRTDLKPLYRHLGEKAPLAINQTELLQWKRFKFNWDKAYNEAIYFHPFVRDVLFDQGKDNPSTVLQYHIKPEQGQLCYCIRLKEAVAVEGVQDFSLEIDELTLNFYETGIGFLAFHLNNRLHAKEEEILRINDFGRRIFPQFMGMDTPRLYYTKGSFLADKIEIHWNGRIITGDDFEQLSSKLSSHDDCAESQFLLPDFIKDMMPAALENVPIEPLLDDRMHVICWVGHKKWVAAAEEYSAGMASALLWHRLIFVDGKNSGTGNLDELLASNKHHTYKRWADHSVLYGICRYSFVTLTDGEWFSRDVLLGHVQSMYFQLTLLSLLQRGSIVRFSEEITRLSQIVAEGGTLSRHSEAVRTLYGKYLQFVNKIYFREVTPQEQGIELYKMIQEKMEIERDVKALQAEIHDFFHLLDLQATERQSDALNLLTMVGSALLVPALALAYYGISDFPEICPVWKPDFIAKAAWVCLAGGVAAFFTAFAWVRQYNRLKILGLLITLFLLSLAAYLPFTYPFITSK